MLDAYNSPGWGGHWHGACDSDGDTADCGWWVALPYFLTYQLVAMLVLANLIVAVILQNFSECGDVNPNLASAKDVELFLEGCRR